MNVLELTDDELRIVRSALRSYLSDFSHDQADLLRTIKGVIAKLPAPGEQAPVAADS
jgi:hypothetical protein